MEAFHNSKLLNKRLHNIYKYCYAAQTVTSRFILRVMPYQKPSRLNSDCQD